MIPCYNAAEFVGDAIRSVFDQTWRNTEVIVVDDASSDASATAIASFAGRIKDIRLESNRGGAFARNRGADISTGEFFLFLDADDLLSPETLEQMVTTARAHGESLVACNFSYLVPDNGGWKRTKARARTYAGGDQLLGWLEGNWSPPCCILWPHELFRRVGGWNESLTRNDDGDIVMRALTMGAEIVDANGGEAFYRRHRETRGSVSTARRSERHLKSAFQVLIDLSAELESLNKLPAYADAISEDLAEIALLSFRAGFPELGSSIVRAARQLRSSNHSAPDVLEVHDREVGGRSPAIDRVWASLIRGRGQVRRSLKRRQR